MPISLSHSNPTTPHCLICRDPFVKEETILSHSLYNTEGKHVDADEFHQSCFKDWENTKQDNGFLREIPCPGKCGKKIQLPLRNIVTQRLKELGKGAAIGAMAGLFLKTVGAGYWEVAYAMNGLLTGFCGRSISAAVATTGIGIAVKNVFALLTPPYLFSPIWTTAANIAGYVATGVGFAWNTHFLVDNPEQYFKFVGPALASATSAINVCGVDMGGAFLPGSLSFVCYAIFASCVVDASMYYLLHHFKFRQRAAEPI